MSFLRLRPRRATPQARERARETRLAVSQLILPYFVRSGRGAREPIRALPGHHRLSVDLLVRDAGRTAALGIPAVLLFGVAERKNAAGSPGWSADGAVQETVRALKRAHPTLQIITDVCLCAYTTHGHCGVLHKRPATSNQRRIIIDNDATLPLLARIAVSHAAAGADMVAPSAMMDGQVQAIRRGLDAAGFRSTKILGYSAKYASSFYGPFREAADSAPAFGDRRSYQMDPANACEALREVAADLAEGADAVMVKPALAYLDVIRRVKERYPKAPLAAYNVSGEYSMVKAAAARGWCDEAQTMMEVLLAIRRAGADRIITYWAKEAARLLQRAASGQRRAVRTT